MTGRRFALRLALGLAGAALVGVGLRVNPARAAFAYLTAFGYVWSLAVGALLWLMIASTTRAVWFLPWRRGAEQTAALLPPLTGLFALLPWAARYAYPTRAAAVTSTPRQMAVLGLLFFAIWTTTGGLLRRWSRAQDHAASDPRYAVWQRRLSAAALPAVALTMSFAAFDWFMPVDPDWHSAIYGVYVFAGSAVGSLGLALRVTYDRLRREPGASPNGTPPLTPEHASAAGKMLLAFVLFWAYAAFSQLLLVWIADVPAESVWYLRRAAGAWRWWTVALGVGQFAVPFALLLSWKFKHSPRRMAWLGSWLVVFHFADFYWLIMPAHPASGARGAWLDVAALFAVGGLGSAYALGRSRHVALLPTGDPLWPSALRYEEP